MKTNKYIIVLISTALFSLTGCTDWLEQEPMSQVTTAVYFKNGRYGRQTSSMRGRTYIF